MSTEDKRDDVEANFHYDAERVFSQCLELHMKNLLGDFSTKVRLLDSFWPAIWNNILLDNG
jgi:hypothetical protein